MEHDDQFVRKASVALPSACCHQTLLLERREDLLVVLLEKRSVDRRSQPLPRLLARLIEELIRRHRHGAVVANEIHLCN